MAENIQPASGQPQGSSQSGQGPSRFEEERKTRELTDKVGSILKDGALRTGSGVKVVWHDPLMFVKVLDRVIDWARNTIPRELFNVPARFLARVGYISLLAAAPVGLVFGITAGVKEEKFSFALYGLAFVFLMLIVQYAACKLLAAGEALTLSSPTVMESDAFLRCVTLISKVTGIVALVAMTVLAIDIKEWSVFWTGVGIFMLCEALSFIALHPVLASTSVVQDPPVGEEAIGIVSFFVKAAMRLVPIIFGLAAFATLVMLVVATVQLFRDKSDWENGLSLAKTLTYTALIPLMTYVGFALYCLGVEVLRAILCIKGIAKKCGE